MRFFISDFFKNVEDFYVSIRAKMIQTYGHVVLLNLNFILNYSSIFNFQKCSVFHFLSHTLYELEKENNYFSNVCVASGNEERFIFANTVII